MNYTDRKHQQLDIWSHEDMAEKQKFFKKLHKEIQRLLTLANKGIIQMPLEK